MTLNVVKVEEEKPVWARPAILRTTSKGARLRRGESIRKGNRHPLSFAQIAEQNMFSDLHASMDQLGASLAEMGFVLEGADDENY